MREFSSPFFPHHSLSSTIEDAALGCFRNIVSVWIWMHIVFCIIFYLNIYWKWYTTGVGYFVHVKCNERRYYKAGRQYEYRFHSSQWLCPLLLRLFFLFSFSCVVYSCCFHFICLMHIVNIFTFYFGRGRRKSAWEVVKKRMKSMSNIKYELRIKVTETVSKWRKQKSLV